MQVRSFLRRAIPFVAALAIGVLGSWFLVEREIPDSNTVSVREVPIVPAAPKLPTGSGISGHDDRGSTIPGMVEPACVGTCALKILSKPRAAYTEQARQENVQGTVLLRVTFLANGKIGGITPVSALPYGLTEQAIKAARELKFKPATRDGKPVTEQKPVQYSFTIY